MEELTQLARRTAKNGCPTLHGGVTRCGAILHGLDLGRPVLMERSWDANRVTTVAVGGNQDGRAVAGYLQRGACSGVQPKWW